MNVAIVSVNYCYKGPDHFCIEYWLYVCLKRKCFFYFKNKEKPGTPLPFEAIFNTRRWNYVSLKQMFWSICFFLLHIKHVVKWLHYILARECVIIISDRFNYAYCLSILSNCSFNSFLIRGINKGHCGQC